MKNRGDLWTDSSLGNAIRDTTFTPARLGIQVFRQADKAIYLAISNTTRPFWSKMGASTGTLDPSDTTNKWVSDVVALNDTTLRVFKGGVATDYTLRGSGGNGSVDTLYIQQLIRDSVFSYHDSLIVRSDSIFVYNTTHDTTYFVGQFDSTSFYNAINTKVDSVTTTSGLTTDTLKYWVNGTGTVYGYQDHIAKGVLTGGEVVWDSLLIFHVTPATYYIDGNRYTSPLTQVDLSPSDPTYPRQDVIALDTTGSVVVLTGTASDNPAKPQVDPSSQLELTSVLVTAGATTPSGVSEDVIFDEHAESWVYTSNGLSLSTDPDNTSPVVHGSKSLKIGSVSAGANLIFTYPSLLPVSGYTTISFWLYLSNSMNNRQNLSMTLYNGSTAVSSAVPLTFSKTTTGSWQLVTVSFSAFTFSGTSFDKVQLTITGSMTNLYIDWLRLQGGITQSGGGSGGNNYTAPTITDGTNAESLSSGRTMKLQSSDGRASWNVSHNASNELVISLAIDSTPISSVEGLQTLLDSKMDTAYRRNDTLFGVKAGVEFVIDTVIKVYYNPEQFTGSGETDSDLLEIVVRDTASAPSYALGYDTASKRFYYYTWPTGGGGSGTVTGVAVASANGLAGTSDGNATTPTLTLSTSVTGMLKGNGTAISAATAGTDYQAPLVSGTNIKTVNGNSLLGSGDLTISSGGVGTIVSATNQGTGAGVFKDTSSNKINLRSMKAGYGMTITQNADEVQFDVTGSPTSSIGTFSQRMDLNATAPAGYIFYQTDERIGIYAKSVGTDTLGWTFLDPSLPLPAGRTYIYPSSGTGTFHNLNVTTETYSGKYRWLYFDAYGTGTTASGRYGGYSDPGFLLPSDSNYVLVTYLLLKFSNAPTTTEDYTFRFGEGFYQIATTGTDNSGCYFRFSYSSGNVEAVANSSGTETAVNTGIPVSTVCDGNVHSYTLQVNKSRAVYFIDGVQVASITTNIPQGDTNNCANLYVIAKTAGTSQRIMYIVQRGHYMVKKY